MIKETKICDCCGKECDFFFASIEMNIKCISISPNYDMCKECFDSFEDWFKKRLNEVKND